MNRLLKGALAVGGGALAAGTLRRAVLSGSRQRYEPWERQPYHEFPHRVLILGGGFAGYKPLGQLVEMGSEFAVNEVLGIKFSGRMAAMFWRMTYLYKLESPQSRARIAADWLLGLFYDPAVTEIRSRE
jgi:hypothetical protein